MNNSYLFDKRLSCRGKGLLTVLLNTDDIEFNEESIRQICRDSDCSIRAAMHELLHLKFVCYVGENIYLTDAVVNV